MAAVFARGLGMIGRRYAPQLMRRMASSYVRNPAIWQRGYAGARQVMKYGPMLAAASNAAKAYAGGGKGSPPAYTSPKKRPRAGSSYSNGGGPAGGGRKLRKGKANKGFTGKYGGKFGKPSKVNINKQSLSRYSATGVTSCVETTGTVADPNCVYLYSHVHIPERLIAQVGDAVARKICEKAFKRNYTDLNDIILGGDFSPTLGNIMVVINLIDEANFAHSTSAVAIGAATTIQDVADAITTVFENYSAGYGLTSTSNAIRPNLITVYKQLSSNTDSIALYTMNLQDEFLDIMCMQEIKLQNRSLNASGGSSTDVVDSNPLQGCIYQFSGIPKSRDVAGYSNTTAFERGSIFGSIYVENGMNLVRAAEIPTSLNYKEPIYAKLFNNCTGVTKARLEPGQIKKIGSSYQKNIGLLKFLEKFAYKRTTNTVESKVISTIGGGVLIAFEDVINVNADSDISITYEVEHRTGVSCYTRKKKVMLPHFYSNTYDNIPD